MFKWLKKLFANPVPEFTAASFPQHLFEDEEDNELIEAYYSLVDKYGFLQFRGDPTAYDESMTDGRVVYQTIVNGHFTPKGAIALQADRSEIIEYWERILEQQRYFGNDVIIWRITPTVLRKDPEQPFRVRLRCAFTSKYKVKPHLLPS